MLIDESLDPHPFTTIESVYIPDVKLEANIDEGFCKVELKPFGPVQLYVSANVLVERLNKSPSQIGLGLIFILGDN